MCCTIILAGGYGTRMKSSLPKVLHCVDGIPMICRIVTQVALFSKTIVLVVNPHTRDMIQQTIHDFFSDSQSLEQIQHIRYVIQENPKGTGHAIQCCLSALYDQTSVLIVSGDTPCITSQLLTTFLYHVSDSHQPSVIVMRKHNPFGYGRILLSNDTQEKHSKIVHIQRIIEEKHCGTDSLRNISLVNAGIYFLPVTYIKSHVLTLKCHEETQEFYLTDLFENAIGYVIDEQHNNELLNVNTPEDLQEANTYLSSIVS